MKEINLEKIISSPDKILFPESNMTKLELAKYYKKIAPRMMPHIRNRKISLVICPQGIAEQKQGSCFYKKNMSDGVPLDPIKNINDVMTHVQNNVIEFHTWGSTVNNLDNPDIMVFDLDPDEKIGIEQIRQGAKDLKSILDELQLTSFLKTSGNKGYHIIVPLKPTKSWKIFNNFARKVAEVMEKKWPNLYTTNVRKQARNGKTFVDWIRNSRGHTSIAPYSVRAKSHARVSMPIDWKDLDKTAPNSITMQDAIKSLEEPDPWKDFKKVQLKQRIKQQSF